MEFHFVCYCHIIVHVGTPMHSHLQVVQSKARIAYIAYASSTEEGAASTNRTNTFTSEPKLGDGKSPTGFTCKHCTFTIWTHVFNNIHGLISDSDLGGKQLWTWPLLKTRTSFDACQ